MLLSGVDGEAGTIQVTEAMPRSSCRNSCLGLAQSSLRPGVPFPVGGVILFPGRGGPGEQKLLINVNHLLPQQLFVAPNLFPPLNRFFVDLAAR